MSSRSRATVALPVTGVLAIASAVAGTVLVLTAAGEEVISPAGAALTLLSALPGFVLGLLVLARRPGSPAGPALLALVAAPVLTYGVERWALTAPTADPWWGAEVLARVGVGIWVFNLVGFVVLCLSFPDGPLPGRAWRAVPWVWLVSALLVVLVVSPSVSGQAAGGPTGTALAAIAVALLGFLATLLGAMASLVVRYRRGDDLVRQQLRWLLLGTGSVPVLLVAGWVAEALGASTFVAYSGFGFAMLVLVPVAVTVAIMRHDLLDVDRLLGDTVAWVLTSVVSAGVFAAVVLLVSELGRGALAPTVGVTSAAFVTALLLLPFHRRLHGGAARLLDRDRTVTVEAVRRFVRDVRDGEAEPEEVQAVLRRALDDDGLRVLLTAPGTAERVDLQGVAAPEAEGMEIPLAVRDAPVAVVVLGRTSRRRVRLARELAAEARLPIEVSRLRLELRGALAEVRDSRARLVEASSLERRRLERDLHDGAQQHVLAVGMRLRSAQARLHPDDPTYADLDVAVAGLEATVAELRRLAHGIRPSGLDDGLGAAVRSLVDGCPLPVEVSVPDVPMSDAVASTAYYVIAEAMANTLKHSRASTVRICVEPRDGRLAVEVVDDGIGGARAAFGLSALQDRVAAHGGRVEVDSPAGCGTSVRALM